MGDVAPLQRHDDPRVDKSTEQFLQWRRCRVHHCEAAGDQHADDLVLVADGATYAVSAPLEVNEGAATSTREAGRDNGPKSFVSLSSQAILMMIAENREMFDVGSKSRRP